MVLPSIGLQITPNTHTLRSSKILLDLATIKNMRNRFVATSTDQINAVDLIWQLHIKFGTSPLPHLDDELDSNDKDDIFPESVNVLNQISSFSTLLNSIHTVSNVGWTRQIPTNYFKEAICLVWDNSNTPLPFQTFTAGSGTVIHLNHNPFLRRTLIHEIASMFCLPDLAPSLAHFLLCATEGGRSLYTVGGWWPSAAGTTSLPFQKLDVWQGLRIQLKDYHDPCIVHPPQTLSASPPTGNWPLGHFDTVLINIDPDEEWPQSKMTGHDPQVNIFLPLTHHFQGTVLFRFN